MSSIVPQFWVIRVVENIVVYRIWNSEADFVTSLKAQGGHSDI